MKNKLNDPQKEIDLWKKLIDSLDEFSDDYMDERNQPIIERVFLKD